MNDPLVRAISHLEAEVSKLKGSLESCLDNISEEIRTLSMVKLYLSLDDVAAQTKVGQELRERVSIRLDLFSGPDA
jgi:hypothetical protein